MSKEKIINIEAQRSLEAQFEARILRDEKIEAKLRREAKEGD